MTNRKEYARKKIEREVLTLDIYDFFHRKNVKEVQQRIDNIVNEYAGRDVAFETRYGYDCDTEVYLVETTLESDKDYNARVTKLKLAENARKEKLAAQKKAKQEKLEAEEKAIRAKEYATYLKLKAKYDKGLDGTTVDQK